MSRKNKGYILIEIIVALLVMSSGIFFIMRGMVQILRTNEALKNNQIAYLLTHNIMSQIYSGSDLPSSGYWEVMGEEYSWKIAFLPGEDHLENQELIITWKNRDKPRRMTINHLIFKP